MDYEKALQVEELTNIRINSAQEYKNARILAAQSKYKTEMILVANLPKIRAIKPSVGIEMAMLMMMEDGFLSKEHQDEVKKFYGTWLRAEAEYKGIEKILDATESKIMFTQSLMRYQKDGEARG